jgi:ribose 5-phosphate isomerase B
MKIAIASDHAGFELKEKIKSELNKYEFVDLGTNSNNSVDYPDYAHALAKKIDTAEIEMGILICGSGNGVNITANKYKNVRAALCWNVQIAELARQHNNANVLSIPARFVDEKTAFEMINVFFTTLFEGGRHLTRVNKISC